MIFSLRLFIIACLVVLQFIAPLVHAHTSEKILSQGLHIPGLEVYDRLTPQEAVDSMQAVNVSSCKAVLFCGDIDGQVVGVDAGFSRNIATPTHKLHKIIADLHSDFLPASTIVFETGFSTFFIPPLTHTEPLFGRLAYFPHSPRAPPAHA
ncbi:MAG: hypothetical protein NTW85_16095 [Methylococcales bacterium]|nr:hypothetical protein [Methylococcales bacterium]